MNLILLFPKDFLDTHRVRLQGRRHAHIVNILRSKVGDELCMGAVNGKMGIGKIVVLNEEYLELNVQLTQEPPQALDVLLILALPRPIVLKRLLLAISSMGIKKMILLQTNRVEKSFWKSPVLEKEKIKEQLILGLEQAKDTLMPEVILRKHFKPFVEDELLDIIKGTEALVAHPTRSKYFPKNIQSSVTLMIGPEGGFVPYEMECLERCGFKGVSLGERILRVETAVPVLLSKFI